MTLTICLWVYSKIRLPLWQATKYCKCINNFNLGNMTFNNFSFFSYLFFMTSTQHSALNIHFQIPGRQLQMVSVEAVFNNLCAWTWLSTTAKSWGLQKVSAIWSVTFGAFLKYPKPPMMWIHLMCPMICPIPDT